MKKAKSAGKIHKKGPSKVYGKQSHSADNHKSDSVKNKKKKIDTRIHSHFTDDDPALESLAQPPNSSTVLDRKESIIFQSDIEKLEIENTDAEISGLDPRLLTLLEQLNMLKHSSVFVKEEVILEDLVNFGSDDFKQMGLPYGPSVRLHSYINENSETFLNLAKSNGSDIFIPTSTPRGETNFSLNQSKSIFLRPPSPSFSPPSPHRSFSCETCSLKEERITKLETEITNLQTTLSYFAEERQASLRKKNWDRKKTTSGIMFWKKNMDISASSTSTPTPNEEYDEGSSARSSGRGKGKKIYEEDPNNTNILALGLSPRPTEQKSKKKRRKRKQQKIRNRSLSAENVSTRKGDTISKDKKSDGACVKREKKGKCEEREDEESTSDSDTHTSGWRGLCFGR